MPFEAGFATATLGGAPHFSIALSAATAYYAASRRLTFLRQRAILWGFFRYCGLHVYELGGRAALSFSQE